MYDKCCKKRGSLSAHLLMRVHDNARSTWLTFFEKSIGAILTKNRMKLWWKWIISDAPPNQITADHVSVYYVMQRKGSFSYKQFGLLDSCWWDKQSSRRRRRRLSTSRYCLGLEIAPEHIQGIRRFPDSLWSFWKIWKLSVFILYFENLEMCSWKKKGAGAASPALIDRSRRISHQVVVTIARGARARPLFTILIIRKVFAIQMKNLHYFYM